MHRAKNHDARRPRLKFHEQRRASELPPYLQALTSPAICTPGTVKYIRAGGCPRLLTSTWPKRCQGRGFQPYGASKKLCTKRKGIVQNCFFVLSVGRFTQKCLCMHARSGAKCHNGH